MRTEVLLGSILGSMLLGLAFLTVRSHIGASADQTVLSQVTDASVGRGFTYYAIDLATALISALAANTSFGGLPVLASLLARDSLVPHVFGLRADRPVYRYGVVALAVLAGLLLVAVNANTNSLIPLYAIGVFTGLTLSQTGLVRYWWRDRPRGWWAKSVVTPMLDYLGSPEIRARRRVLVLIPEVEPRSPVRGCCWCEAPLRCQQRRAGPTSLSPGLRERCFRPPGPNGRTICP